MLASVWEELCRLQSGVVTRAQALACGVTDKVIESRLRSRRWQRLYTGVFATFSGPPQRLSRLWAALLRAGPGAALSHESAAELQGLVEMPVADGPIHVTVPTDRTPARIPGVVVHRSSRVDTARHPSRLPPQTRVEDTVVDLTQTSRTFENAMGWLARAVNARLTTPERLASTMEDRRKLRWRGQLGEALRDVENGCHSLLELCYFRNVERAHGLPRGERQVPARGPVGRIYRDVEYRRYRTVVELDGLAAHPDWGRWRDMRRDNASVAAGRSVLRYGPGDVYDVPCRVALQAAQVLQANGWCEAPKRCRRPDCVIA
jgi:very-short-patch-repair endonuclease